MPTAKKLPSGSWRCLVYSHTEEIKNPDGSIKKKRIYESFTSNIPGPKGKRIAEQAAAEFAANKDQRSRSADMLLGTAMIITFNPENPFCRHVRLWTTNESAEHRYSH